MSTPNWDEQARPPAPLPLDGAGAVLLVDHDDRGKSVYQAAGKAVKKASDLKKPFEHVAATLYFVAARLAAAATESRIVECFTAATPGICPGGKAFSYKTSIDLATDMARDISQSTWYG